MSKFATALSSAAGETRENGTIPSTDALRNLSIGRVASSHEGVVGENHTALTARSFPQTSQDEATSPISPVSDLESDGPPPPSTDVIDQVIASAMALANSVPVIPKSNYDPGRLGNGHSTFQTLGMPPPGRRSITPSGFHPAAVGLDGRVNLFVGNLPYRVRWQDVKDLFRRAGTVLRADVSLDVSTNRSRGYGTVLMGSREDGVKAIEMFNGYNWQTRTLEVRPDRLPPEYEPQPHVSGSSHHQPPHPPPQPYGHPQGGQMHNMQFPMGYGGPSPFGGGMPPQMGQHPMQFHNTLPGQAQSSSSAFGGMWQGPGGQSLSPVTSHASPRHPGQAPYSGSIPPTSEKSASPIPHAQVTSMGEMDMRSFSMTNGRLSLGSREDFARLPPRELAGIDSAPLSIAGNIDARRSSAADLLGSRFNLTDARQSSHLGANGLLSLFDASAERRTSLVDPTVNEPPFSLHRALGETVTPPRHIALEDTHGPLGPPANDNFDDRHRGGFSDTHPLDGPGGRFEFDPSMIPQGNHGGRLLIVGNLPYSVQWQELKDLFRTVGHVLRADIPTGPDKRSRGFGTILYASEYDAESAVMRFDGMDYAGRVLRVQQERNLQGIQPARGHRDHGLEANFPPPFQAHFTPSFGPPSHPSSPKGVRMQASHFPSNENFAYPAAYTMSRELSMNAKVGGVPHADSAGVPAALLNSDNMSAQGAEGGQDGTNQAYTAGNVQTFSQLTRPPPSRSNGAPHPGRIVMPSFTQFNSSALSPLQTRGLPPMTPSMPGFTFHAYPSTPPLHPMSYLSPGLGPFSPGLPYNGPPVYNFNPYMNPAPGAPVNVVPQGQQENPTERNRPAAASDEPEYFPAMTENTPETMAGSKQTEKNGKSGGDDSAVDNIYEALQAIQDKVEGLSVTDEIPSNGASSNRASFDGSRTGVNLLSSIFNDQRRASMDDTKRKQANTQDTS